MWMRFKFTMFVLTSITAIVLSVLLLTRPRAVYRITMREIAGLVIYLLAVIWFVIAMV